MGFLHLGNKIEKTAVDGISLETLHRHQCGVCPLNQIGDNLHPHMSPSGSAHPVVYILGEAPGAQEDKKGEPFVGPAGRVLRSRIPSTWEGKLRYSNVVRTRPPKNREPTQLEIECCRLSVISDIEATKPKAIFGFGNIPLFWALKQTGISKWRGRYVPIRVGTHSCWFFPMFHPSYILRGRKFTPHNPRDHGSDDEFVFARDLARAFDILPTLPNAAPHDRDAALTGLSYVTGRGGWGDVDRVVRALKRAYDEPVVGVDYETPCLRPYTPGADLLSVAISTGAGAFAFPLTHPGAGWSAEQLQAIKKTFSDFLYGAPCRKVAHHLPFELEWSGYLYGKDVIRATRWEDTESQAYTLDARIGGGSATRGGCLSLEFLCLQYFGLNIKAIDNLDRKQLEKAPVEDVLRYNALDAKYHLQLYQVQAARLQAEKMTKVYRHLLTRVPTFVLTQLKGVPVDQQETRALKKKYRKMEVAAEDAIDALPIAQKFLRKYGHHYRPASPQDTIRAFAMLGHTLERADEDALAFIDHPLSLLTLKWRKAHKALSTYILPLMPGSPLVYPDGMLHPTLHHARTRTTRSSSSDVNIQNYPKRDADTKEVRRQVRGPDGTKVVSFDYGQIQARNVAMESKDKALIKAFWDRYDIHEDWMLRIFKAHPDFIPGGLKTLQDEDRKRAFRHRSKNEFVFPSFFGAQPKSKAASLDLPLRVMERLHEEFYDEFPGLKKWHADLANFYYEYGYVTGLSGFRRWAPVSPNELINTPIQADEALIVTDAMTRLSMIDHDHLQASMEIHDDLTFIWPKKRVDELAEITIREMLHVPFAWARIVPITVEMSIGDNWADMKGTGEVFSSADGAWR